MSAAFLQISGEPPARSGRVGEVTAMPYASNSDLPASVQAHLPPHAQDIYREAFNHAFAAHVGDPRQEEAGHRIAWAAVKRSYVKVGGSWIGRD
jgi:cation transport regulator